TAAPRPSTLTTASSITQTGTLPHRPRRRQSDAREGVMSEDVLTDDQSHYEISLTAGQAFVAFVLLLLSLAASFAFGLMIGKGQADERLVVRKEPAVINEGPAKKTEAKLVDLGIGAAEDFKAGAPAPALSGREGSTPAGPAPSPVPVPAPTPATASGGVDP